MKRVSAFEAKDGSLHKTKEMAAQASLLDLGIKKNNDKRGTSLDGPATAFIIDNYKAVRDILNWIDEPEVKQDYRKT